MRLSLIILITTMPGLVHAGFCTVPGTHPAIQDAIQDVACTQIELGDQTFVEDLLIDRSISIEGANPGSSVIQGQIGVMGFGTVADLSIVRVENGCALFGVQAILGSRINGMGLEVANVTGLPCDPGFIFENGFETETP